MASSDPRKPKDEESFKEKLNEKLDKIKQDQRIEGLFSYAKSNTKDTVAYILLIIGIILLFFQPHWGAFLIGLIAGLYFSEEIVYIIQHFNDFIEEQGLVRVLVLGALAVSFFIMAPFIFFGALAGAFAKKLLLSK
ncbi:MAG TPA: hypothetical protein PLC42_07950 [Parachlamydiaceae bacterium]|nr:hypothetical protein [Parachlamydiaceae bacterium]